MAKRFRMSKRHSKRDFARKALRVSRKNHMMPMRGGIRA